MQQPSSAIEDTLKLFPLPFSNRTDLNMSILVEKFFKISSNILCLHSEEIQEKCKTKKVKYLKQNILYAQKLNIFLYRKSNYFYT